MLKNLTEDRRAEPPFKFDDPFFTAQGLPRASVELNRPRTLWFNTGTVCNITCDNCFIESSPRNDRLVFITADEVENFLFQIRERRWPVVEIGITGGEPFMNPQIVDILQRCLRHGFETLVLTNAMRPMMRPRVQGGLLCMRDEFPGRTRFRVSLDHYREELHDKMRGKGSFQKTLEGMNWLRDNDFAMAAAGRMIWNESEAAARRGYGRLFASRGYRIDARDPGAMVLFPEISESEAVPEISEGCWEILGKHPEEMMCASSRMVVKRKGATAPTVLACTLIPYDKQFELGTTLESAEGPVMLNHPSCAQFCVLGGASCSRR